MKKLLSTIALTTLFASQFAQAVPWCHRGTIVEIADVTWNQSDIMANFTGSIPSGVSDPEVYTTATATNNYAMTFAGGGGGFGGYSVPGSGQVIVVPYAPSTYTSMAGPGYYYTSQGVQFKLKKCYTIPPMTIVEDFAELHHDTGGTIGVKPLNGLEAMPFYWEQPLEERPVQEPTLETQPAQITRLR